MDSPGGQVCTKTCLEECPQGWDCVQVDTGADPIFICLPRHLWICRPCTASTQCAEGLPPGEDRCVDLGTEGAFCGGACAADEDCPVDFLCQEKETVEGGFSQQCGNDGCGGDCGTCQVGWACNGSGICENQQQNPCGTIDYAGICSSNTLKFCHAPGNTNSPCYTPPNCALFQMTCTTMCINAGYWSGVCDCGYQSICPPDSPWCCFCSCS